MRGGAPIGRRELVAGGLLSLAIGGAEAARAQAARPPPSPFGGDPEAPAWPPAERIALWPGAPPGAPDPLPAADWTMNGPAGGRRLWVRGVGRPELHVFRPARPDGSALLCLPGGGYGFLSVQSEGMEVARAFNALGTLVAVLTCRLPGEGWRPRGLVPLHDARRAMRLLRARAASLRLDPARLGVIGFSAGGHLAADLSVSGARDDYARVDEVDALSARPAFAGLIYPVTTLQPGPGHGGSAANLLGRSPSEAAVAARSPVLHVDAATPPMFLIHAYDDPIVPAGASMLMAGACAAARVPVELRLLAAGGHGFGMGRARGGPAPWAEDFKCWSERRHPGTPIL